MGRSIGSDNSIVRRDIASEVASAKFTVSGLVHMVHYCMAAELIVTESKRLGAPVSVLSLGCGDMWELRTLVNGMYVKKSTVLRSYTGVDIMDIDEDSMPIGHKLREQIQFTYLQKDLTDACVYPLVDVGDASIDVAICTEFIEHVDRDNAVAALDELAGITRCGGLLYLTTPNADNSISSDPYHVYEWSLDELVEQLEIYWTIESCMGTYIRKHTFDKVNRQLQRIPDDLVTVMRDRFSSNWCRVMLATPYPEYSEGIAIKLRRAG